MKSIISKYYLLFALIIIVTACKEIGPPIDLTPSNGNLVGLIQDSSFKENNIPSADTKRVLIEEFSGQKCPNCPAGHKAIEQLLQSSNGNKISAVTMHSIAFMPQSLNIPPVDFRNDFATTITNNYGNGVGIPCAIIDRVMFSGQTTRAVLIPSSWSGYVTSELTKSSYVNINLKSIWQNNTSKDSIVAELHFTGDGSQDNLNFSLMLVEDSIIAGQDSMGVEVHDYVHNNILRTMLTSATGVTIKGEKTKGNVKLLQFRTDIIDKSKWNIDKMRIIAFVHKQNSNDYEVVQVAETKLK